MDNQNNQNNSNSYHSGSSTGHSDPHNNDMFTPYPPAPEDSSLGRLKHSVLASRVL